MPRRGLSKAERRATLDAFILTDDDATERELLKPTGSEAVPHEIAAEDPKGADPLCAGPSADAFSETAADLIGKQCSVYQTPQPANSATSPDAYAALVERLRLVVDAPRVAVVLDACHRTAADLLADVLRNGQRPPAAGEPCPKCGKLFAKRTSKPQGESVVVWLYCGCKGLTKTVIHESQHRRRNTRL